MIDYSVAGFDPTQHLHSWRSAWRTLTKKADLPGFRFHDLRHCAITLLAENGASDSTIMKMAQKALTTVDTDVPIPPNTPQTQVDAYKGQLRSFAYSIIGTLEFKKDQFAQAETDLRKSIEAYPAQPDPVVVLRLAIALDRQEKYADALKEANHAVELTQEGTPAGGLARQERDRLQQLANKPAGSPPPPPADKPKN